MDSPKIEDETAQQQQQQNTKTCSNIEKVSKIPDLVLPRMKKMDADASPLLGIDEVFKKRWQVQGLIGKGGYGEIYLASDTKRGEEVAIKVEPKIRRGKLAKRMILEQKALMKMQGKPHVPRLYASGYTENLNFIIMQLLSINIGEIRKSSPCRKLSKSTTGRILHQTIDALHDMHQFGYIHRDVKPANMCFGIGETNRHTLILLDFGLIRRYKKENGEFRSLRSKAGFRGTHRYVSVRVHSKLEQSSTDDIISLLYTGYELMIGELPWKSLERGDEIKKLKQAMQNNEEKVGNNKNYFENSQLIGFAKLVFSLDPTIDPPYSKLQDELKILIGNKKMDDPYDWEDDFKEAIEENDINDNSSK
ncbi:unnamed protein product [Caenorhabditis angaria]|uniref:non-specific serine/threonine protein kinase n=1 Tax=Caenorhabditis angaria TaxID=860376 RepID=A0A9P1IGU8_9PELO|nr:unnamed protein product [Caenorhabditis angaria]